MHAIDFPFQVMSPTLHLKDDEKLDLPAEVFGIFSFQEPGSESWRQHLKSFLAAFQPGDKAMLFVYGPGRNEDFFRQHVRQALPEGAVWPENVVIFTDDALQGKVMRACHLYLDGASALQAYQARLLNLPVLLDDGPRAMRVAYEDHLKGKLGSTRALHELAKYTGEPFDLIESKMNAVYQMQLAEWQRTFGDRPSNELSEKELQSYYQTTDTYLYDLTGFNYFDPSAVQWRSYALFLTDQLRRQRGTVRVLDFGGGIGSTALALAELPGVEVTYLDLPGKTMDYAQWRFNEAGRTIEVLDGTQPDPLGDRTFDLIVSFDVLEHVPEPEQTARYLYDHLNDDGVFVVSVYFGDNDGEARWHLNCDRYTDDQFLGIVRSWGAVELNDGCTPRVFRKPGKPAASLAPQRVERVLLLYQEHFYTTAKYFRKAFSDLGYEVQIAGPGQAAVGGIEVPHDISVPMLLEAFPEDRRPQLVVYIDVNLEPQFRPTGLDRVEVPTVGYFIDSHLNLADHLRRAGQFDHVGVSHGQYVKAFHDAGISQAFRLPCSADPEIFKPMPIERDRQVVFVGNTGVHPRRVELLRAISERYDLLHTRAFFQDCAAAFAHGEVVFNCSLNGDLNMRVFEAMAAGALLVTDRLSPETGLESFFRDREHLALYDDEAGMFAAIDHYLAHPEEARRVRENARKAILAGHTYHHRAMAMLEKALTTPSRGLSLLAGGQYFAMGEVPAAIAAYAPLTEGSSPSPEALNNLGACTFALGNSDDAKELFAMALQLDPHYRAARENLQAVGGEAMSAVPAARPAGPLDGDVPDYYRFARPEVKRLVPQDARRILDIGCAAGALGASLKAERPGLEVVGVEYDRKAALHAARRLDAVLQGSVDDLLNDFPYPKGYFDCFVLADVLEHLPYPEQTLSRLLPYLKEGGHLVISLPNVRHYEVVGDLLINGNWTYQDAGILDRTHLRFYTYKEIERWMARAGLQLEELDTNRGVANPQAFQAMCELVKAMGGDDASFRQEGSVIQYVMRLAKPVTSPGPRAAEASESLESRRALVAAEQGLPVASIVVLTLNQLAYTQQCLESIFAYSTVPFELIVVDNGSTDGTRAYLRRLAEQDSRVKLMFNDHNTGFAHGCNQGIAMAEGEVIVLLNNDTVVTENWLEGLINPLLQDPQAGAVGPRSNQIVGPQQVPFVPYGSDMAAMHRFAAEWAAKNKGKVTPALRTIGFCMAIRRSALEKVGGLDTRFGIGNFEDDDLCIRLIIAGFRLYYAEEVFIHHYGHVTFTGEKVNYGATMAENSGKFCRKWGLPEPMKNGYPLHELITKPFDPARDVFPIVVPGVPGLAIDTEKRVRFLALPDWSRVDDVIAAIKVFNATFTGADDVTLLLWVDARGPYSLQAVGEVLGNRLHEAGLDGDNTPELVLFDSPGTPIDYARLFGSAQICLPLGNRHVAMGAEACGLTVVENLTPENLKKAAGETPSLIG